MLKIFMDNDEEELQRKLEEMSLAALEKEKAGAEAIAKKAGMDPVQVMKLAVEKKSFDGLQVVD